MFGCFFTPILLFNLLIKIYVLQKWAIFIITIIFLIYLTEKVRSDIILKRLFMAKK